MGVLSPVSVDTSRTDVLPSFALRAELAPTVVARAIAGRAVERPAFADYIPALGLSEGVAATPNSAGSAGRRRAQNAPQSAQQRLIGRLLPAALRPRW